MGDPDDSRRRAGERHTIIDASLVAEAERTFDSGWHVTPAPNAVELPADGVVVVQLYVRALVGRRRPMALTAEVYGPHDELLGSAVAQLRADRGMPTVETVIPVGVPADVPGAHRLVVSADGRVGAVVAYEVARSDRDVPAPVRVIVPVTPQATATVPAASAVLHEMHSPPPAAHETEVAS